MRGAGQTPNYKLLLLRAVFVGLTLAFGAFLLAGAATAPWWGDTILLGIGGITAIWFALFWIGGLARRLRIRNKLVAYLALATSPIALCAIGAVIGLRYLLLPGGGWQRDIGVASSLLFLSPIIIMIVLAVMFLTSKSRP